MNYKRFTQTIKNPRGFQVLYIHIDTSLEMVQEFLDLLNRFEHVRWAAQQKPNEVPPKPRWSHLVLRTSRGQKSYTLTFLGQTCLPHKKSIDMSEIMNSNLQYREF